MRSDAEQQVADGSARRAFGAVVGYEDLNGNGRLDLVSVDANPIDRVVATNPDVLVFYLEGSDAALDALGEELGTRPDRGFGFLRIASPETDTLRIEYQSLAQPYDLMLSDDPLLGTMMCQSGVGESASAGSPEIMTGFC